MVAAVVSATAVVIGTAVVALGRPNGDHRDRAEIAVDGAVHPVVAGFGGHLRTPYGVPFGFRLSAPLIRGLYPGAVRPLAVTVRNPYDQALKVTDLSAELISTSSRRCRPARTNLDVRRHSGPLPLVIPAHRSRAAGTIPLHMPHTVADACQGATFHIELRGTATKVRT